MLTERSRYDEIRSLYINQLAFTWMEDSKTETTRASVDNKIDSFFEGDLEHATEILSALWEIANKDGDIKAPSKASPAVSLFRLCPLTCAHGRVLTSRNQAAQVTSPAQWASVKIALIKSIRKGVFFDRKYWARYSKAGDILKPVYFSNTIMGDKAQQLNKCTSKFGYGFAEVLRIASGQISRLEGSTSSHERPRGRS